MCSDGLQRTVCKPFRYFGQYGKILKIALSPGAATPPGTSAPAAHSCYITYVTREEAEQAILAVDGVVLDGRTLKASFGTPLRYAQLSDELEFSREFDDTAAPPGFYKTAESSGPAAIPPPGRALAPALAPPPVSPAAPPGASSVLSQQCYLTAGRSVSSAPFGCGAFAPAAGRCSSMPETGDGAVETRAMELTTPNSGCRPSVPLAQSASASQDRGTIALAHVDSQAHKSNAVKPQSPHRSTAGMDSFSWAPNSVVEPPRGTSSSMTSGVLGSVEGSGVGGALVGGSAASPRVKVPCATGSSGFESGDSEPWSMMGSFEALVSGSLLDEVEGETPLASRSRFARFFDAEEAASNKPGSGFSGVLGAGGVHGSGLDGGVGGELGVETKLLDDDWQQGFRALLPDVNISFSSPFGDHALNGGRPNVQLGGISSFSGLGSGRVEGPQQNATPGVGDCGNGGGSSLLNGSLHHAPLNGVALPGLAGDSGVATPKSLLQQLSGSLPGAHLSAMAGPEVGGAELSSQLHSLLHLGGGGGGSDGSAGGGGGCSGGGGLSGAISGAASDSTSGATSGDGGGDGSGNGAAARNAMQRSQRFMPGWLPTEGLLAEKPGSAATEPAPGAVPPSGRDTGASSGRTARERRNTSAGNAAGNAAGSNAVGNAAGNSAGSGGDGGGNAAGIGMGDRGSDRGSKAKKRGGTNRGIGSKGAETKPVAVHK